ncbi:MAG: hypothetical protein ABSH20_03275 [Tepidisphaeraceae bacterium]
MPARTSRVMLVLCVLLACMVSTPTTRAAEQYPAEFVGTWKSTITVKNQSVEMLLSLKAAGQATCQLRAGDRTVDKDGTWVVSNNVLRIVIDGNELLKASARRKGDELILNDGPGKLVRVEPAQEPVAPRPLAPGEIEDKVGKLTLPPVKLRSNLICGYVVNSAGKPIAEKLGKVKVHAWTRGLHGEVHVTAVPDDNGYYEMKVEEASYSVDATLRMIRDQRLYVFDLRPVQTRQSQWQTTDGVRMDFVWSLSGVRPDHAGNPRNFYEFYGMHVKLAPARFGAVNPEVGGKYVFELVPKGTLVDGSEGQRLTREWKIEKKGEDPLVYDIPIGTYIIEGRLVGANGGSKPLKFNEDGDAWWDRMELAPAADGNDGKLKPHYLRMAERDVAAR